MGEGSVQPRGAAVAAQFDEYRPFPDLAINGHQTLSENIADLAGLWAAYEAYKIALNGQQDVVRDGLTGDQRFFIAFAQSWRSKVREAELRMRVALCRSVGPASKMRLPGTVSARKIALIAASMDLPHCREQFASPRFASDSRNATCNASPSNPQPHARKRHNVFQRNPCGPRTHRIIG